MVDRERRLTTIVAIDVAGYSRLMHADETETLNRLHAARAVTDSIAEDHGARIVGTWGDGLLVEFPSVVRAVEFAHKAQAAMVEFNEGTPEDKQMLYRIGINLGDVIVEDGDLYGDGVNVAARLEALSTPGGIVLSGAAREQVRDKLDIAFEDLGEVEVRNIVRPVRAFRVLLEGEVAPRTARPRRPSPAVAAAAVAAAAVVLVALLAGTGYWYAERPDFEPADPAKMEYALDEPSIAVLAFDNLTGDAEQEHIADGISEDIISILARLPGLVVIARNSSFSYKGQPVDVRRIAEELSVRYVLEGSLQRADESVRVTAQLIDAVSGRHVWAEQYDRPREEFFKLRDQITRDIIAELNSKLLAGDAWYHRPDSYRTMDAWLIARKASWYAIQFNRIDNQISIDLYRRILEMEPGSANAHASIAHRHAWNARARWTDDRAASFRLAEYHAKKAIAIDDASPNGYAVLAWIRMAQGRVEDAVALQEKVLEMAPGDAGEMAYLALYLQKHMEADRSAELFARAIRMNSKAPGWIWENYSEALVIAGRYADAIPVYRQALEHGVKGVIAGETHLGLAACHDALGRPDEAQAEVRAALEAAPDFSVAFIRDYQTYTDQDYKERWLATLKRLGLPEE